MAHSVEEASKWIIWLSYVFMAWILAVVQIYSIYRLYSIRHLIIIQKRYAKIVFFEAITTIFHLLITVPLVNNDTLQIHFMEPYSGYLVPVSYAFIAHALVNAEAARLWLIYYDLNYLYSLKNESWKSIINTKQQHTDWFLTNKQQYGNKKWVITRVFVYYFISSIIVIFLWYCFDNPPWVRSIDGGLYGLPVIITLYTYYKSPKHSNDYFLFQYEFRISSILMIVGITVYLSACIIFYISIYVSHIMLVSISILPSFLSLISSLLIPHKISSKAVWSDDRINNMNRNNEIVMAQIVNHDSNNNKEKKAQSESSTNINTKLLNTLQNLHDLELFIDHISHEFSSEIILSFIEFVQFKKHFGQKLNRKHHYQNGIHLEDIENSKCYQYDLDEAIPKSSIVYGEENDNNNIKNSAYLLYTKYIKVGAELEINLPSALRGRYQNIFNNYDLWMRNDKIDLNELVLIFDAIINEMFFLLRLSYTRFTY